MIFHFITGLSNAASYASMANGITTKWFLGSLAGKVTALCYPCGSSQDPYSVSVGAPANAAGTIMANQPTGDIYLIGFSFGGYQAGEITTPSLKAAGRIVHLMLLDPVNFNRNNAPGEGSPDPGESITGAVEVIDIYRGATESPWSFEVINTPNSINVQYCDLTATSDPCGCTDHHGDQVGECPITQQYLENAFNTGNFLTSTPVSPMNVTTQPVSQSIVEGSPATFTASIANAGEGLSSAWQSGTSAANMSNISGTTQINQTTAIYTIPAVTMAQNGMLFRAFFNAGGVSIESNPATLTVTASPPPPPPPPPPPTKTIVSVLVTFSDGTTDTVVP